MTNPSHIILVALACLALTTFFSLATQALRKASWVFIEEAFETRHRPHRAHHLREQAGRLQTACATLRLCSNLAFFLCIFQLGSVVLGQRGHDHPAWLLAVTFLVSVLFLSVFSVTLPYAWADHAGNNFLIVAYPFLVFLALIAWPIVALSRWIEPAVSRIAGATDIPSAALLEQRQEELLSVVEAGKKEGVVDQVEHEMIESVLEFRGTTAGEIMTPRTEVAGIDVDMNYAEVLDIILRSGYSRFPVYEQSIDKIIGLLYAKDLLADLKTPSQPVPIRERMREPFFVPDTKPLRDLLHELQHRKVHLAVVLDEYGGTAGVATIEDILEELVGEIADEYEGTDPEPLVRIDDHTLEVDARYRVAELNDAFSCELPEDEDYDSIGGYVIAQLGRIPVTHEVMDLPPLRFTILNAEPRKINRLRITRIPLTPPAPPPSS